MTIAQEISIHLQALDRLADRLDPTREGHRVDPDRRTVKQRVAFEIDAGLVRLRKAKELASK